MGNFIETLSSDLRYYYTEASEASSDFHSQYASGDVSIFDVLRAHFCLVDHFIKEGEGEGIGGIGVKDQSLLISALSRQYVGLGAVSKWSTVHEKAATLMFGLIKNHPFYDANKRTAYLSTVHYLSKSGFEILASEKELEDLTVWVANNELDRFSRFQELKRNDRDPEVRFIAHWLGKKTRKVDEKQYHVTYRELERILKKYDVWLENPSNNSIDVMHRVTVEVPRSGIFQKQKFQPKIRRAFCLDFPGWNKKVSKDRLGYIRKELKLTPENGVDSQSFFRDIDDMRVLLGMHEDALRRLAYR